MVAMGMVAMGRRQGITWVTQTHSSYQKFSFSDIVENLQLVDETRSANMAKVAVKQYNFSFQSVSLKHLTYQFPS